MVRNAYQGPGIRARGDLEALKALQVNRTMMNDKTKKGMRETLLVAIEEVKVAGWLGEVNFSMARAIGREVWDLIRCKSGLCFVKCFVRYQTTGQ